MTKAAALFILCVAAGFGALPQTTSFSASPTAGFSATFTAVWTDTDGASDISFTYAMVATSANTVGTCTIVINSSDQIFVMRDDGSWQNGITPGSTGTSSNSHCTLSGTGSSVKRSGTTLTAVLNVSFQPGYVGQKNLWSFVQDHAAGTAGLTDLGDFTVTAAPPSADTRFYIDSTRGNDSNAGTSPETAWKTLSKVGQGTYSPGTNILFRRGERWRGESLTFKSSGTAGNPIVLDAYGTGAAPVIDGSVVVTGWVQDSATSRWYVTAWTRTPYQVFHDGVFMYRAASVAGMSANRYFFDSGTSRLYVWTPDGSTPTNNTIEASVAPNAPGLGLFHFVDKSYITIRNFSFRKANMNTIAMVSSTLGPSCDHFNIEYNTFDNSYANNVQMTGSTGQGNPSYINVIGNTFTKGGTGRGYMRSEPAEGVAINFQGCQHCMALNNTVNQEGGEAIQVMAGASDVMVSNNRLLDAYAPGLYILSGTGNCGDTTKVTAKYNTITSGPNTATSGSVTIAAIATERCHDGMVRVSGNTLSSTASTFRMQNGWQVDFTTTGSLPAPLVSGAKYWVINASGGPQFQVASTKGGPAITITSAGSGSHSLHTDPWVTDTEFSYNTVIDNVTSIDGIMLLYGSGATTGGLRRSKIHHNVFYGDFYGVQSRGPTDDASHMFSSNIFVVKQYGIPYAIMSPLVGGVTNSSANFTGMDHDLFYDTANSMSGSSVVAQWGASTFYTLSQWHTNTVNGHHAVLGNPLFRSPGSGDFTLQAGSPAINAGAIVPAVQQEQQGAAPDMGRFEYVPGKLGTGRTSFLRNRFKAVLVP